MDAITAVFRFPILLAMLAAGVVAWFGMLPDAARAEEALRPVTAAVPRHFPPQYQLDAAGKPGGFAIDVLEAVARRANLHVTYRMEENFVDAMAAVRTRRADLIPNLGITAEREHGLDFSTPVETFPVVVFVRSGYDAIKGVEDLGGHRVVVVTGNVAADLLRNRPGVELILHASAEEALFDLLRGQADAFVAPAPLVLELARQARVENHLTVVGRPLVEIKRAMAVRAGDAGLLARLNRAIDLFVHSAEYREIYQRWHTPPEPYWTSQRVGWLAGGLLLLTMLGMGLWRYYVVLAYNRRLAQQLDELRHFQKLTIGRELRIKELKEQNAALRARLGEPTDGNKGPAA